MAIGDFGSTVAEGEDQRTQTEDGKGNNSDRGTATPRYVFALRGAHDRQRSSLLNPSPNPHSCADVGFQACVSVLRTSRFGR